MAASIPEKFHAIIDQSVFVWFTTVREDGTPQPAPVWYVRDGDSIILYSMPDAQKVRNVRANPKVALGWANEDAGETCIITGEAVVDPTIPPADQLLAYQQKYREDIPEIGYTPATHAQTWSLGLRVIPNHVHGYTE
ncbi:MAG: pyridoxamine 5'-phosphate oxidase family protein [Anaerolineae bacterium]